MKKSIFFKLLMVIGLILTVLTLLSTPALAADDDDPWSNVEVVNTDPNSANNNENTTPVDNIPNANGDNSSSNTNISGITGDTDFNFDDDDDNVNINTGNADANSAKDDLAYTGVGNTTKIVVLIAIIGGIVAIYSYKKVSDYRSL